MRKFITLLVVTSLTFVSCSKDDGGVDDSTTETEKRQFNTPNWTQGVWERKTEITDGSFTIQRFTFTKNNIIYYTKSKKGGERIVNYRLVYNVLTASVVEKNEGDKYTVDITPKLNVKDIIPTQTFTKLEDGKMEFYPEGVFTGIFTGLLKGTFIKTK